MAEGAAAAGLAAMLASPERFRCRKVGTPCGGNIEPRIGREERVGAWVDGGLTAVAARFGVAVSSVVKWSQRYRTTGSVAPGKMGGHRKRVLEPHRAFIMELPVRSARVDVSVCLPFRAELDIVCRALGRARDYQLTPGNSGGSCPPLHRPTCRSASFAASTPTKLAPRSSGRPANWPGGHRVRAIWIG